MAAHIRRRPILTGVIAVLLVIVLILGGRAAWRLGSRLLGPPPPPRQTDVSLIADWMSVPYISRVYRVPRPELYRVLGSEPDGRDRRSLREWAQVQGRSSDETVQLVQETVLAWQASHPEPPRPSPPPDAPPAPALAPPKPDEPQPPSPIPSPAGMLGPVWESPSPNPSPARGRGEPEQHIPPSLAHGGETSAQPMSAPRSGWAEGAISALDRLVSAHG